MVDFYPSFFLRAFPAYWFLLLLRDNVHFHLLAFPLASAPSPTGYFSKTIRVLRMLEHQKVPMTPPMLQSLMLQAFHQREPVG